MIGVLSIPAMSFSLMFKGWRGQPSVCRSFRSGATVERRISDIGNQSKSKQRENFSQFLQCHFRWCLRVGGVSPHQSINSVLLLTWVSSETFTMTFLLGFNRHSSVSLYSIKANAKWLFLEYRYSPSQCPYGNRSRVVGFSRMALKFNAWINNFKEIHKEAYAANITQPKKLEYFMDLVYVPIAYWNLNERIEFVDGKGVFTSSKPITE